MLFFICFLGFFQTPCQQELDQVLERISTMRLPDERGPLEHLYSLHIPNCDKHGLYNLKQASRESWSPGAGCTPGSIPVLSAAQKLRPTPRVAGSRSQGVGTACLLSRPETWGSCISHQVVITNRMRAELPLIPSTSAV